MNIVDFAQALPKTQVPRILDAMSGFTSRFGPRSDFVPPRLRELNPVPVSAAPAVLLIAPAATGKSTSAKEIARISSAAFLDLARKEVADGSFLGMIDDAFGLDEGLAFKRALKLGDAVLIIDSLDETHVRSQESPFTRYLAGLCRFLRTATGNGNIVLLSRFDTAQYISHVFEEENVSLRKFNIEFFNEDEARQFIDLKLDKLYDEKKRAGVHRQHRQQYEQALNGLLERLVRAIGEADLSSAWSKPEGERLLGYSPVLEGIASYLCVPDFRDLKVVATKTSANELAEWEVLSALVFDLLEREQGKFLGSWPSELEAPLFGSREEIESLYSPKEQVERVLSRTIFDTDRVAIPQVVPKSISKSYQEAVGSQLGNHPFFAKNNEFVSSIFRDFATAMVLIENQEGEALRAAAIRAVRSVEELSTPALAPFLVTLSGGRMAPPISLFDIIASSLSAREREDYEYTYMLSFDGNRAHFRADLINGEGVLISTLSQQLNASGEFDLELPRSIKNTYVTGAKAVSFSWPDGRIGPNIDIAAEYIAFRGSSVHIDATGPVELTADVIESGWDQRVEVKGDGLVMRASESEGWPQRYAEVVESSRPEDQDVWEKFLSFRRFLRHFRRTAHIATSHLAANREELDRYVLRTDLYANLIAERLANDGWLSITGPDYIFDLEFLSLVETNQGMIFEGRTSQSLDTFLVSLQR